MTGPEKELPIAIADCQQAFEYHKQALNIAKEVGNTAGEGGASGSLGKDYHTLGDYQQALEYHKRALSVAKEVGNKAGEGGAYGILGKDYHTLGDYQRALDTISEP